jgi:hypothetical protein
MPRPPSWCARCATDVTKRHHADELSGWLVD